MTIQEIQNQALGILRTWFHSYKSSAGEAPSTYVICAGLAVSERMRQSFPLQRSDYMTPRNQVKTSGPFIQSILRKHGEERKFTAEGGRTTRGTVPAAESLVSKLNEMEVFTGLTEGERVRVIEVLQAWLVERVRDYFNRQKIEVEVDLNKPSPQIVLDILTAAGTKSGAVAQHLVGAKLAVRFPDIEIENFSYTTADQQLGRPGDFVVRDTAFHVTVSPMPAVLNKCDNNLRNGYRPMLLVPESRLQAARQMAEALNLEARVGIISIESFLGQNIEELGEFGRANLATGFRQLLAKYNERVSNVENDRSLLIGMPANL